MSYCSATKKSAKTGKQILVCDLAEGHERAYPLHHDKTEQLDWRSVSNQPAPLQNTRTTQPPKKSALKAAQLHTTQFEVVTV